MIFCKIREGQFWFWSGKCKNFTKKSVRKKTQVTAVKWAIIVALGEFRDCIRKNIALLLVREKRIWVRQNSVKGWNFICLILLES